MTCLEDLLCLLFSCFPQAPFCLAWLYTRRINRSWRLSNSASRFAANSPTVTPSAPRQPALLSHAISRLAKSRGRGSVPPALPGFRGTSVVKEPSGGRRGSRPVLPLHLLRHRPLGNCSRSPAPDNAPPGPDTGRLPSRTALAAPSTGKTAPANSRPMRDTKGSAPVRRPVRPVCTLHWSRSGSPPRARRSSFASTMRPAPVLRLGRFCKA